MSDDIRLDLLRDAICRSDLDGQTKDALADDLKYAQDINGTEDEALRGIKRLLISGVRRELTPESTVSNVWRFCVWRIRLDEGAHVCRADFAPHWGAVFAGGEKAFAMPAAARRLSAAGVYRVGFAGLSPQFRVDVFDARFFHRWLSDDELARVHANGMEELARRGIPLWAERPAE
jgi:hypothetical protein